MPRAIEKSEEKKEEIKEVPAEENTKEVSKVAVQESVSSEEPKVEKPVEKKPEREERPAIAYIYTSQNNTIVHITDLIGNTISRVSGGMVTKHSRLKSDPTIAMFIAKRASERAKDLGITSLYVRMRAKTGSENIGSGAHAAVKSLDKEGFRIISIVDTTRVARGGPKKKGGKRGRRV